MVYAAAMTHVFATLYGMVQLAVWCGRLLQSQSLFKKGDCILPNTCEFYPGYDGAA